MKTIKEFRLKRLQDIIVRDLHRIYLMYQNGERTNSSLEIKAWGQYLDIGEQVGIFGTSSAIQILNLFDEIDKKDILKYQKILINAFEKPSSIQNDPNTFSLIYKICFFLNSLSLKSVIKKDHKYSKYFDVLLSRMINDKGWGDYYKDEDEKDKFPRILPTIFAINTLQYYEGFIESNKLNNSISYLEENLNRLDEDVLNIQELQVILDLAIITLVELKENSKNKDIDEVLDKYTDHYKKKLKEFIKNRKQSCSDYKECFYHQPINTIYDNPGFYIIFPTHILNLLAIVKLNRIDSYFRYFRKVIKKFSGYIRNGGFKKEGNSRVSTVDHYWIGLLFHEFSKIEYRSARKLIKFGIIALFLIFAIGGIVDNIDWEIINNFSDFNNQLWSISNIKYFILSLLTIIAIPIANKIFPSN